LPSELELPPKSLRTLSALETKKAMLTVSLSSYCINDDGCYNKDGAKDYLRSYCCSIFEQLKEAYSDQIFIWDWEDQIVGEAIRITLECWDNFNNIDPPGSFWRPILREAIAQHLHRPIRQRQQRVFEPPATPSPLLSLIQAQSSRPGPQEAPSQLAPEPPHLQTEVARRETLLSEYKAATGASNKKIYEARNSGIYKPEFYQWRDGRLPANSVTAKRFEAFLKAKKRPIPRKPTI